MTRPTDAEVRVPSLEEILAARTERGGWTRETLASWGVPWPPPKGWKSRLAALTPQENADDTSDL